jgi:hypothetical protein
MATACLLNHDLDGGAEALNPLLAQPVEVRNGLDPLWQTAFLS